MEEKIYKIMRGAGALNIVLGVISLVVGIAGCFNRFYQQLSRIYERQFSGTAI